MSKKLISVIFLFVFIFISCENETQRKNDNEETPDSVIQTEEEQDADETASDTDETIITEDNDIFTNDEDAVETDGDTVPAEDEDIQTPDSDSMECDTPGETTEEYECPDGVKVIWCICDEFYTSQCIDSPESLCETTVPDEEISVSDEDTLLGTVEEIGSTNQAATVEIASIFRGNEFAVENGIKLKEISMFLKPSSNITFVVYKKELDGFSTKYKKKATYDVAVSSPATAYNYYSTGEIDFDLDGKSWGQPSYYIIGVYSSSKIGAIYGGTTNLASADFTNSVSKQDLNSIPDTLDSYNAVDESAYSMRLTFE